MKVCARIVADSIPKDEKMHVSQHRSKPAVSGIPNVFQIAVSNKVVEILLSSMLFRLLLISSLIFVHRSLFAVQNFVSTERTCYRVHNQKAKNFLLPGL